MAYLNNIPGATQQFKNSQPEIQTNFAEIQAVVSVDHVDFNTGAGNQGKHKKVTLPVQVAAPAIAADNGLYNLANVFSTKNETYIHGQKFAGTMDTPMTSSVLSKFAPANNQNGWSYLPSGILMVWGTQTVFNGTVIVTLDPSYPVFTNIFTVIPTPYDTTEPAVTQSVRLIDILSNTQFRLKSTGATAAKFIIIGV